MNTPVDVRLVPAALSCWITAIVAGGWPGHHTTILAVALGAAAIITAIVLLHSAKSRSARWAPSPAMVAQVLIVLIAAGVVSTAVAARTASDLRPLLAQSATTLDDAPLVTVVGVVTTDPRWSSFGSSSSAARSWQVEMTVQSVVVRGADAPQPVGGRLRLRGSGSDPPPWRSVVQVRGTVSAVGGGQVGGPVPSTAVDLALRSSSLNIVAAPPPWVRWSTAIRGAMAAASDGLSPQGRGLVPGIAIGDTTELPDDVRVNMRTAGMTHMTAVSGSHFAIVGALVWSALGWARLPGRPRAVGLAAISLALVVLVRPEPSVLRAAVMAGIGVLAIFLRRPGAAVPALATSVIVLTLIDPAIAREPGFILSVAATAGLVLLVPLLDARLGWLPGWLRAPWVVAIAAQLPCAPVVVLLDPTVSLWTVPANAVAGVAMAPATLFGLAAAGLAVPWPAAGAVFAWLASCATAWIAALAHAAAVLPGSDVAWWSGAAGLLAMGVVSTGVVGLVRYGPDLRWWFARWLPALARGFLVAHRLRGSAAARVRDRLVP